MLPYQIIEKKSKGEKLSAEEINEFIEGYTAGRIPDYQTSALLMAIFIKGMDTEETLALTKSMLDSGDKMDFSAATGFVADKHSTGGVGDKVSILLAPIMAVLGIHIPMISGRGLGHSGGTLDKLESIPGFDVNLSLDRWRELVLEEKVGLVGQTGNICPADKKLYSLRDVTATVRSIPLISASIMSKKIAEGIQGLVLDVKTGNGAFMQTLEESRALAKSLVSIGKGYGIQTKAVITDMNQPLGLAIGNWVEMKESVQGLQGNGPEDLMAVTYELGAQILMMADPQMDKQDAIELQQQVVNDGRAFEKLLRIVELQGGDPRILETPEKYPKAAHVVRVNADGSGFIAAIDTLALGFAGIELGAGRRVITDPIDHSSGMYMGKKLGDPVSPGDELITLHSNDAAAVDRVAAQIADAFTLSEKPAPTPPLIVEEIL
ncbi:MAG: thymidine phosphorylase [Candidatus Marinimicrobia bacterium]|nr:thymidine phosphorylase [Candidatus Neomarinimicrobiota bacterium]